MTHIPDPTILTRVETNLFKKRVRKPKRSDILEEVKTTAIKRKEIAPDTSKLSFQKPNKSVVVDHTRYVEILGWVQSGASSTQIIINIAEAYGFTLSSASTYYYNVLKYWRSLYAQEDIDMLRAILREKYEYIVSKAVAEGDYKSAKGCLDSIRKMSGLDKQEVEVTNKEVKFKFDGVPTLDVEENEVEEPVQDFIFGGDNSEIE